MTFEKTAKLDQGKSLAELEFTSESMWRLKYNGRQVFESKNKRLGKVLYIAMTGQNRVTKERQANPYIRNPETGGLNDIPQKNFADTLTDRIDCDRFVRLAFEAAEPFDIDWETGWDHAPDIRFFDKKDFGQFKTHDELSANARLKLKHGQIGVLGIEPTDEEDEGESSAGGHITLLLHGSDGEIYVLHKKGRKEFKIELLKDVFDGFRRGYGSQFAIKEGSRVLKSVRNQMRKFEN